MNSALIEQFDRLIRRDPARRGLIGADLAHATLCAGHLDHAAAHLAASATSVALVTGFFIPHGKPPAAETDGPPGTLLLALALHALGIDTLILSDEPCLPAIRAAARASGLSQDRIAAYPHAASHAWIDDFFHRGPGRTLSHLIAVERVGPSHTRESLAAQFRDCDAPVERFLSLVPQETHGCCHNMRGQIVDAHTADIHRLFEEIRIRRPLAKTIGIGDGGNEIGMGSIPWEDLCARLEGPHAPRIPCRVATDWTIIAGTSNWGAYALAAALLCLRDRTDVLHAWGREHQQHVLQTMVAEGPAIDGVTGRRESTVDGLPFLTYIQPWQGILRHLGIDCP